MKMEKTIFLKVLLVVAFSAILGSCGTVRGLMGLIGLGNLFERSSMVYAGDLTPPANTQPVTDDDFAVRQNSDNTVTILGFKGDGSYNDVVIPERIYGLPVKEIAPEAFRPGEYRGIRYFNIRSVVIPDSVTSIGARAFESCDLTSVTLPAGLTSIGESAFRENKITSINLPAGLTSIGEYAFYKNQLTSVTLPASLTRIGEYAFSENKITSINLPAGLTTSIGGYAFYKNQLTSVTLPAGLTSIGESAFRENKITSVTLSAGLTSIGESAFNQNSITSVTLPAGLTSIGSYAFGGNPITSVTILADIERVGSSNFGSSVTSITLPASINIENWGFESNFRTFYINQNRAAGTYTRNGPIWARSTAGGIE